MSTVVRKEDAHRLVDRLPANATWDDLMREIYLRETIEKGRKAERIAVPPYLADRLTAPPYVLHVRISKKLSISEVVCQQR